MISLALGLGVNRMGHRSGGGPTPGWTPDELFSNGELGGWYDPSDLSTLFQDSAMTNPVVADGDPVGAMLDKSGNGIHLLQATSGSRPTYKTDGSLHWLECTAGVDFMVTTDTIALNTATGDYYIGTAQARTVVGGNSDFLAMGLDGNNCIKTGLFCWFRWDGSVLFKSIGNPTGEHYVDIVGTAAAVPVFANFDAEIDGDNAVDGDNDGVEALNGSAMFGLATSTFSSATNLDSLSFYGGVVVMRTMSAQNRTEARTYFSGKTGL